MPREGCLGAEAAAVENSREMERQRMGVLPRGPRECLENPELGHWGPQQRGPGSWRPGPGPFLSGKSILQPSLPCPVGQQTGLLEPWLQNKEAGSEMGCIWVGWVLQAKPLSPGLGRDLEFGLWGHAGLDAAGVFAPSRELSEAACRAVSRSPGGPLPLVEWGNRAAPRSLEAGKGGRRRAREA